MAISFDKNISEIVAILHSLGFSTEMTGDGRLQNPEITGLGWDPSPFSIFANIEKGFNDLSLKEAKVLKDFTLDHDPRIQMLFRPGDGLDGPLALSILETRLRNVVPMETGYHLRFHDAEKPTYNDLIKWGFRAPDLEGILFDVQNGDETWKEIGSYTYALSIQNSDQSNFLGSTVRVGSRGLFFTASHVLERNLQVTSQGVKLMAPLEFVNAGDGSRLIFRPDEVKIFYANPFADLIVLQIENFPKDKPYARLGEAVPKQDEVLVNTGFLKAREGEEPKAWFTVGQFGALQEYRRNLSEIGKVTIPGGTDATLQDALSHQQFPIIRSSTTGHHGFSGGGLFVRRQNHWYLVGLNIRVSLDRESKSLCLVPEKVEDPLMKRLLEMVREAN